MDGKAIFQKWQYSQMIYVLNAIFNKLPASFLHNGQVDPEIFMEMQGNKKSQKKKKEKKNKKRSQNKFEREQSRRTHTF